MNPSILKLEPIADLVVALSLAAQELEMEQDLVPLDLLVLFHEVHDLFHNCLCIPICKRRYRTAQLKPSRRAVLYRSLYMLFFVIRQRE